MATTTPNYGWSVPTSTDYVAQGAVAIETLGDSVDASLFGITNGKNVGLVPLNTTTFSSVATVTVDNIFTTTYDNYVLEFSNLVASTSVQDLYYQERKAGATNNVDYRASGTLGYVGFNTPVNQTGGTYISLGVVGQNGSGFRASINNPKLNIKTTFFAQSYTIAGDGAGYFRNIFGGHNNVDTYDGFVLTMASGTFSGTLRVYGLRNS